MWVQFEPSQVHVAIDVSLKELAAAWSVADKQEGPPDAADFLEPAQKHKSYILDHLVISSETTPLKGRVIKVSPPPIMADPERTFFQYELEYPLSGPPPRELNFYHEMLKEWPYAPDTAWDVSYIIRAKRQGSEIVNSWLLGFQKSVPISTGYGENPREAEPPARSPKESSLIQKLWHSLLGIWTR